MSYIRKRAFVVAVLVIVVVAAATTLAFAGASGSPQTIASPPPPPLTLPTPVTLLPSTDDGNCTSYRLSTLIKEFRENADGKSAEEVAALKQELNRQIEAEGLGKIVDLDSPEAWGAEIEIAGKMIKLPDDARVKTVLGEILVGYSSEGKCYGCEAAAQVPITCIERGDSLVSIGRTGVVLSGNIAPGEIGAFDFLKEVLTDQKTAIDSLPVKAPVKDSKLRIVSLDELNLGYENMSQSPQGGNIVLSPSPSPPAYEYLSQDLTLNDTIPPVGPPKKNFGMFVWQVCQNVPVYWRTTDDNVRPEAVTVIKIGRMHFPS